MFGSIDGFIFSAGGGVASVLISEAGVAWMRSWSVEETQFTPENLPDFMGHIVPAGRRSSNPGDYEAGRTRLAARDLGKATGHGANAAAFADAMRIELRCANISHFQLGRYLSRSSV